MMDLYNLACFESSKRVTNLYSTSFSLGIKVFDKKFRAPIYGIYGFVRFADEIVDTFHDYDKKKLLEEFKSDTYKAIREKISLNPILHSFQNVVNEYNIEEHMIESFLNSMEMDLYKTDYGEDGYNKYIYGSAEVVGLMCLKVFCQGNDVKYKELESSAKSLGAAFQKINFLRDMKSDYDERGRVYFPHIDFEKFNDNQKAAIESDIKNDFDAAYIGIKNLPDGAKFGVYLAYKYYTKLFSKISRLNSQIVKEKRIRVNDSHKIYLLLSSLVKDKLNLI